MTDDPKGFDAARWALSRFGRLMRELDTDGSDLSTRAAKAIDALADTVEDLCIQFGAQTSYDKAAAVGTMGLSALEGAFYLLGWHDPHRVPAQTCDQPKCYEWATCGTPTPKGYRRVCGKHFSEMRAAL